MILGRWSTLMNAQNGNRNATGFRLAAARWRPAAVLAQIPKRATTILTNSRGKPWIADGFRVSGRDELMR